MTGATWLLPVVKTGRLSASITDTGELQHFDVWACVCLAQKDTNSLTLSCCLFSPHKFTPKIKFWKAVVIMVITIYYWAPFPNNVLIVPLLHLSYKINKSALPLSYIFSFKPLLPDFRHKQDRNWFIWLGLDKDRYIAMKIFAWWFPTSRM